MSHLDRYRGAVNVDAWLAHVARDLACRLGDRALDAADQALEKMRILGNDEGLEMWLGIQEALQDCLSYGDPQTIH